MNINLRSATRDDRHAIWRVHTSAIRGSAACHYNAAQIEAWAGRLSPDYYRPDPNVFLVAEVEDGSVVGFGEISIGAGEIEAVFVDPEFGRRGIGRRLLRALEDIAVRHSLTHLILDASLNAVTFYEQAGYQQVEPTVCVYGKDAISVPGMLMTKDMFPVELTGDNHGNYT